MRNRVTGARLPSDTASHPGITVVLRVSRRCRVQLCTQWMTLIRFCDVGSLELTLHYNFFLSRKETWMSCNKTVECQIGEEKTLELQKMGPLLGIFVVYVWSEFT